MRLHFKLSWGEGALSSVCRCIWSVSSWSWGLQLMEGHASVVSETEGTGHKWNEVLTAGVWPWVTRCLCCQQLVWGHTPSYDWQQISSWIAKQVGKVPWEVSRSACRDEAPRAVCTVGIRGSRPTAGETTGPSSYWGGCTVHTQYISIKLLKLLNNTHITYIIQYLCHNMYHIHICIYTGTYTLCLFLHRNRHSS